MKNKVLKLLMTGSLMLCMFTACSNVEVEKIYDEDAESINSMFVAVEKADGWTVVYQRDTKVMYVISRGGYNQGNFTLMVDENGDPLLYEGE